MQMIKKILIGILLVFTLGSFCAVPAFAAGPVETAQAQAILQPRADIIIMKFRVVGGQRQYRRWNETQEYWVDPYWMNY